MGGGVFGEDTEEDAEEDTEEEVIGAEEAEKVLREEVGAKGGRGHGGGGYGNRCKRKHRRGYGGGGYGGGY